MSITCLAALQGPAGGRFRETDLQTGERQVGPDRPAGEQTVEQINLCVQGIHHQKRRLARCSGHTH